MRSGSGGQAVLIYIRQRDAREQPGRRIVHRDNGGAQRHRVAAVAVFGGATAGAGCVQVYGCQRGGGSRRRIDQAHR